MSKLNERLESLFEAALARYPDAERTDYLERECPPELRQEIESLLAAHDDPDVVFADDIPRREAAPSEVPGTVIGPYKLLEPLGEGGFGTVWLAVQSEPVRRQVALKIIKLGMDTKQVVARFEVERQALALMDHPNIARVLDAGATDNGRPYFVMELVHGISITKFCEENKLATAGRLDLFIKVCHAVQHAHQKGIIHRDLKPSNILVTLHDGVPVPKVIDFGVAKAIDRNLTDQTLLTQITTMIGTPAYMSPEQAEMSGLDVDTRSDIYSLGVLLYELLTGTTPFSEERLRSVAYGEMQRIIAEEEPERPSTRLKRKSAVADQAKSQPGGANRNEVQPERSGDSRRQIAEGKQPADGSPKGIGGSREQPSGARQPADGSPKGIGGSREQIENRKSKIENDLDWIVMKCLEKDRTRRYETANGLAADIQRHLKQEPVVARPPSAAYRFQKLLRRNKLSVAAGGAVATALIAGLAVSLVALTRERAANARAEQRLMTALQQVESVLTNDLPAVRRLAGSTRTSESMLRNALAFMSALAPNASDNPEFLLASARVHANLAMLQGNRYMSSLGDPESALASASNAWTLLRSIPTGALSRVRVQEMTFRAEQASGLALEALGREDEALAHFERMLTLATGLDQQLPRTGNRRWTSDGLMGDCRWTSEAHAHLGTYFKNKRKWEQSREHYDHLMRDPYLLTNTASEDLSRLEFTGSALWARAYYYRFGVNNLDMALDYFRQSLSFSEAHLKRANSDQIAEFGAVMNLVHIGMILCEQRNHAEGLPIVDEALRRMESLAAGDKANWNFQNVLGEILLAHAERRAAAARAGEFSSAERLSFLEQARTSYQRCLERMNASAATSRQKSWVHMGADAVKRELEETMHALGQAYQEAGMLDQAVALFEDLFKIQRGADNLDAAFQTMERVTRAYEEAGRPDSAETFYRSAETFFREQLAQNGSGMASLGLGRLLLHRAKTNTANPSLAQKQKSEGEQLLRDYLAAARKRYANDPEELEWRLWNPAEFRYRRGDFAEAEPLYREILRSRRARLGAEDEGVLDPAASLGRVLADWAWAERDRTEPAGVAGPAASDSQPSTLNTQLSPLDRAREAEKLLRECLAIRLRGTNSTHWRTAEGKSRLGGALVSVAVADPALRAEARGAKLAEAESLLLEGNEALQASSADNKYKRDAVERLVRLYDAWGQRDKVSAWRQRLEAFDKTGNEPSPPEEQTQ